MNTEKDTQIANDLESLQSHLLFLNMDINNAPEQRQDGRIIQKIDANNITLIKWEKIQNMIKDAINQFKFCSYELRIYNADTLNEASSAVLKKLKEIGMELNFALLNLLLN